MDNVQKVNYCISNNDCYYCFYLLGFMSALEVIIRVCYHTSAHTISCVLFTFNHTWFS
jgi:hypothetical protein